MITDKNINWLRKRKYISYWEFSSLITGAVDETGAASYSSGELIQQKGGGADEQTPDHNLFQLTANLYGLDWASVGDTIFGMTQVPFDLDPNFSIGWTVHWSPRSSSSGDVTWILETKTIKKDGALVAAASVTDTLDSTIGVSASSTQYGNEHSDRGILLPETYNLSRQNVEDGAVLELELELDAVTTYAAGQIVFFGLIMDYMPMRCYNGGNLVDAALKADRSQ